MAAYRRVYDSRHLQTDCQEPGSAPESYYRQSSMGYIYLLHSAISFNCESGGNQVLLAYCVHVRQQSLKSLKYWQQKAAALPLTPSEYRSFTTDIPCVYNELIDKCSLHGNNWRLGATREDPGPRASVPCVGSPDSDSVHSPHRGAPRNDPFPAKTVVSAVDPGSHVPPSTLGPPESTCHAHPGSRSVQPCLHSSGL